MRRRFFNISNIFSKLNYFSIISLEDNSTVSLPTNTTPDLMYSLNGSDWTQWNYSTITIDTGDILYLKGDNRSGFSISSSKYNQFSITGKVKLVGNIMSLIYKDDFENNSTLLLGSYIFYRLFFLNCTGIVSAKDLELPATELTHNCYSSMFQGCTSLTTAPELPATTLVSSCYNSMFQGCTSLTTAPELPATTLVSSCYSSMFRGCTSLITAPELPATTLSDYCYNYMFYGCTSLTTAPELIANTLTSYCYSYMFYGCTSLTTAPELPATTLTNYCYNYMFYGCTSLTIAPVLPATTLTNYCYSYMFRNCTSLTTAPVLPATTLANYCYSYMFYGCTKLNHITMLATNINATNCLNNWVYGVASTGTFIKAPGMTSLPTGSNGIPSGWTVKDYNESNLITFYISNTEYQAEEGMTWGEWVNSEYNIDGYENIENYITKDYVNGGMGIEIYGTVCYESYESVNSTDIIQKINYIYDY